MAGWGLEVFTACNYWFWVPLVAPPCGGLAGATLYEWCIQQQDNNKSKFENFIARCQQCRDEQDRAFVEGTEELVPPVTNPT